MDELHYLTLSEVCHRTKSGELSARTVTETILERIHREDVSLRSYARLMEDQALLQADQLDADRAAGKPLGLLHGVPVAVKDLLDTQGVITACGTTVMADRCPDRDATVVTRLREAGAVIVGKTQLTEGAWSTHHPHISPPLNPWNPAFWTGVSSSGSGVATAAGLCYAALGTDTAGSIRFPSAACGVVGLKPTYGRVSRAGAFPLAESLDHIGPLTRSVEDAGRVLQVLAGYDRADVKSLKEPVPDYLTDLESGVRDLRIGIDEAYLNCVLEPDVIDTLEQVIQVFEALGARRVSVELPDCTALLEGIGVTVGAEAALAHQALYPARKEEYGAGFAELLEAGLRATALQYAAQERAREIYRAALEERFDRMDLLLAPPMIFGVPTLEQMESAVADPDVIRNFVCYTAPFNYSGHPSLTLPVDLNEQGLPRSFQLIGPRLDEAALLKAGHAYEMAAGFKQHPS